MVAILVFFLGQATVKKNNAIRQVAFLNIIAPWDNVTSTYEIVIHVEH